MGRLKKLKKNIWIFNHYATDTFKDRGGRHFWFAENLIKLGHQATIFCASTLHNTDENMDTGSKKYKTNQVNDIPYVFIKTPRYVGNGKQRIKNMIVFYRNLFPAAKEVAKIHGKPDVILASSVHPLTLIAGIKLAKKFGIPCVCEVRDLWPESLIEYGSIKRNSLVANLLYRGERWIYKKCDKLIFTMEGGKDYIIERGWNKERCGPIDLTKVHHINNGVDLERFTENIKRYIVVDLDLNNSKLFKVVYTGSIRKANNVDRVVEIADIIQKKGVNHIKFLIYGRGTEKENLEKYCFEHDIKNIQFKGFVDKNHIPYVLSKSDLNIVQLFSQNGLKRFGTSVNKMFEYFASGKPTLSDCEYGYDLIQKYQCGIVIDNASTNQLAEAIINLSNMPQDEVAIYSQNALKAAQDYDFKVLTRKLEQLL